jgi:hypothetical protein
VASAAGRNRMSWAERDSAGAGGLLAVSPILVVAAGMITWESRGIGFFGDEWRWIFDAVHPTIGGAFQDWASHLMATTFGLFDLLPRVVGLSQLWPYRAVSLILHLGIVWAVFALASRRIGPRLALLPAAVVAFLGSGSEVFLTSLDYNALIATLACLVALVCVDRRTLRSDLGACALLIVGIGSFTLALAYAAGLALELFVRDRFRRVWVVLTPLALYAVWRVEHGVPKGVAGDPSRHPLGVLKDSVRVASGAFAAVGGIQAATSTHANLIVIVVPVVMLGALILAVRAGLYRAPRFLNLTVTGAVLWVLIGYARGAQHDLFGSRYVYQGAVVATLLLVELWVPFAGRARVAVPALVAATLVSVGLNTHWMVDAGHFWRSKSAIVRAKLTALEIARDTAPTNYRPGQWALLSVTPKPFFDAVSSFGSPGLTLSQLRRASEPQRRAADRVLIGASEIRFARIESGSDCPTKPRRLVRLTAHSSARFTFAAAGRATIRVSARRFADEYSRVVDFQLAQGGTARIAVRLGAAEDPWQLRVASDAGLCRLQP